MVVVVVVVVMWQDWNYPLLSTTNNLRKVEWNLMTVTTVRPVVTPTHYCGGRLATSDGVGGSIGGSGHAATRVGYILTQLNLSHQYFLCCPPCPSCAAFLVDDPPRHQPLTVGCR